VLSLAWVLAFWIRFEFDVPAPFRPFMLWSLPSVLAFKSGFLGAAGVFRILWAYVGLPDLRAILRASAGACLALYVLNEALLPVGFVSGGVVVLDGLLTFLGVGGLYAALRTFREAGPRARSRRGPAAERLLIVGAGDAGETLLRELERHRAGEVEVVGFVDDDARKQGRRLRGVPVLGRLSEARAIARARGVRTVYVAVPGADGALFRRIAGPLLREGVAVRALPPIGDLSTASRFLPQLREVAVEDLLRRPPVRLDSEKISGFIRGKSVLVTGAAGSIGSELCRQVLGHRPSRLVALDCAETPLHDLLLELRAGSVCPELGDVTDFSRIRTVFEAHRPQLIFHAAALKHVPVCEASPREAVRVNVGGTRNVAEAALRARAEYFGLVSTDKAVNPSSVMGATKRAAELVIQRRNGGATRFIAVRFGNVLGSNGSVLKIFRAQLARGGPLTVTHPEMRRYFMTIPEAVQLVLQAALLGQGGEVFELDMGSPVRIVDLAEDLIRLSGMVPGRDVRIEFTGVRPGEKLFEELYFDSELVQPTCHPKVFRLKPGANAADKPDPALPLCLDRLGPVDEAAEPALAGLRDELLRLLKGSVAEGVTRP
jgi:FlaA1/EpsC-like NDP-sugar epimerase